MKSVSLLPLKQWQQDQKKIQYWATQPVSGTSQDVAAIRQRTYAKRSRLGRRPRYDYRFSEVKIKHEIAVIHERIKSTPYGQTEIMISEYRRLKRKLRWLGVIKAIHRWSER